MKGIELKIKFLAFLDERLNRKKKRKLLKKIEAPMEQFLRYLEPDPWDLEGELYKLEGLSRKQQQNFEVFFKEWKKFLVDEGLIEEVKIDESDLKKNFLYTEKDEGIRPLDQEESIVSVHAKVKLLKMKELMAVNLILSKQLTEEEFKNKVSVEIDVKLTRLARKLHRSSLLISEGNSKGMDGDFRYYYHHEYNLVIVEAIDEGKIVTIFESYIDPSIASDILAEKRRNKKLYETNIDELRRSHKSTLELVEHRRQQLRLLEKQEKSLERSIMELENGYDESQRAVKIIINKEDNGIDIKFN